MVYSGEVANFGFGPCAPGSLDEFMLERYTAFTHRGGVTRRFDVDHAPWPQARVDVAITESELLQDSGPWLAHAELAAAHYSAGVRGVTISWPRRVGHYSATAASGVCAISAASDQ